MWFLTTLTPKQTPTQDLMNNEATTKEASDEWTIVSFTRRKKKAATQ